MRSVVAITLPQLACELGRQGREIAGPLAAIVVPDAELHLPPSDRPLDAVDDHARRYGVRPGQRASEAHGLVENLTVVTVGHGALDAALGRVAEVALAFAPTAAIELERSSSDAPRSPWGETPFDTVWLDVTGAAHLAGGEETLLADLAERVAALGHRTKIALGPGPRVAQALARWSRLGAGAQGRPTIIHSPDEAKRALAGLPVQALPLDADTAGYLMRLGVMTIDDLHRLPRARAAARLGPRADDLLRLAAGHDDVPLLPFALPREILEEVRFDEGVESTEALLFVLRGMTSRASVRLSARGESCARLEVGIELDRSIAALRRAERAEAMPEASAGAPASEVDAIELAIDFPAPLAAAGDLLRVLKTKLERVELLAPAVGVRLRVAQIVVTPKIQLDLSRGRGTDPDRLPTLLAELSAELGPGRVGLLDALDEHRPEARSRIVPVKLGEKRRRRQTQMGFPGEWNKEEVSTTPTPTRLLPEPILLGRDVRPGSVVAIPEPEGGSSELFAVEKMVHVLRLDDIDWWHRGPQSRDYARAWLVSGEAAPRRPGAPKTRGAAGEALVYMVRRTKEVFLQGWFE